MIKAVLDASALLAFFKEEPLSYDLEALLSQAVMSTVNACEVATIMMRLGMPKEEIDSLINETIKDIIVFDRELSLLTAHLWKSTKAYGLSLGDRACIALGQQLNLPIYTADTIWKNIQLENVDIRLIR